MTKPFTWVLAGLVVVGLILASVAPALADDPGLCRGVPGSVVLDVVADPLADIYVLLGGAIGNQTQADFFLQRYGGPCVGDPTFGNGGVVSDRVDGNTINVVNSVAVGPGGIITRGITKPTQFSPGTYTKSLYSPQGTLLMRAFDETVMDFNPVALANLLDGTSNTLILVTGSLWDDGSSS